MRVIAQSRFLFQGIFPRKANEANRKELFKARKYLENLLVSEFNVMHQKTFNAMCDHVVSSSSSDTVLVKVWIYYKEVFITQMEKMIQTVIHASPTVIGTGCVHSILGKCIGDVTPKVFKDLNHHGQYGLGAFFLDCDGYNVNFSQDVATYPYVLTIRCIFNAINSICSLVEYIASCPRRTTAKSLCIIALQLDSIDTLVSDGQVGSAVRAIKHVFVIRDLLNRRIQQALEDDEFNLSSQETHVLERCTDITASIEECLPSCPMQIFRSFMRDKWERYWVNPIRPSTCGYHSTEKTFENMNPHFMAFGTKVQKISFHLSCITS